jgi:hypothetical protein
MLPEREDAAAIETAPDNAVDYFRLIGFCFEQSRWEMSLRPTIG